MLTPCIHICAIEPGTDICIGCGRTLCEITGWSGFTEAERSRIMESLPSRMRAETLCGDQEATVEVYV